MKKIKIITIVAAVLISIMCVVGISKMAQFEMASIAHLVADDLEKEKTVAYETAVSNNQPKEEETKSIIEKRTIKGNYSKYVFVGDSRYRGMMFMAEEEDVFICESGRGYDFLLEQMSNIKMECDEDTALIIGLGVNDSHYNTNKYLNTLGEMAEEMDCQIYYMLINPVDEEVEEYNGYHVLNENIDYFNEIMIEELDERIGIIDTNSYLWDYGFETMDGLHYTNDTYEDIYNFIKSEIVE